MRKSAAWKKVRTSNVRWKQRAMSEKLDEEDECWLSRAGCLSLWRLKCEHALVDRHFNVSTSPGRAG